MCYNWCDILFIIVTYIFRHFINFLMCSGVEEFLRNILLAKILLAVFLLICEAELTSDIEIQSILFFMGSFQRNHSVTLLGCSRSAW